MPSETLIKPYQELAAAVILQAIRDFQSRRDDPGEEKTAREEARDFLRGAGDFGNQRHVWCHWLGIQPESLSNFVEVHESGTTKGKSTSGADQLILALSSGLN